MENQEEYPPELVERLRLAQGSYARRKAAGEDMTRPLSPQAEKSLKEWQKALSARSFNMPECVASFRRGDFVKIDGKDYSFLSEWYGLYLFKDAAGFYAAKYEIETKGGKFFLNFEIDKTAKTLKGLKSFYFI